MKIVFLLCLLFTSSCSLIFQNKEIENEKGQNYSIDDDMLKSWHKISPAGSDIAYENKNSGSIIFINSICNRYQETPLRLLAQNLLDSFDDIHFHEKKYLELNEFEVFFQQATGTFHLEKVEEPTPVIIQSKTFRAYSCIFDFILIATNENSFQKDQKSFKQLFDSFRLGD